MFLVQCVAGGGVVQEREGSELDPVAPGPDHILVEDKELPGYRVLPILLDTLHNKDAGYSKSEMTRLIKVLWR